MNRYGTATRLRAASPLRRLPSLLLAVAAIATAALHGCASSNPAGNGMSNAPGPAAAAQTLNRAAGASQTVQVVAGVLPLGAVPYDNQMLPLVSPDGRYIATQTGAPPTWPTMLAEAGAEIPSATRIEVYELDLREGIKPEDRKPPALIASVAEPMLLGRTCDAEGFLVESPREDGARWIGKASWRSGEVKWLVSGGDVNAFACLGSDGRLAWSRRAVDGQHFDLVVRSADGEWAVAGDASQDWLMPTWSGRSDSLFFLTLRDGNLVLRHALAANQAAMQQSLQSLTLASESGVFTAYQTVIGQAGAVDASILARDQLVFFHPGLRRTALWRPLAASDRQRTQLNSQSITAVVDEEDFALVTLPERLIRQNLRNPAERITLVAGTQVARQTNATAWPYILLSPGEGAVGVMAMRLLPREESIFSASRDSR